MPLFDAYLMADWSAANVPRLGRDSIWIAYGERTATGVTIAWNRNVPTRRAALDLIAETMADGLAAGRRLMAGFDFAFGYPQGAAERMTGQGGWRAVWAHLADAIVDDEKNASNRLAVAAALNGRLGAASGARFWGNGTKREHDGLARTKSGFALGDIAERRRIEIAVPGAKTVWQLAGAGAVGSQSLVGIAALERLRRDPRLAGHVAIWPFETGFATDLSAPIVVTEIYPSLLAVEQRDCETCLDAAQVRTVVETFAALDGEGDLVRHLARPETLGEADAEAVLCEEGWIVGATTLPRPRQIGRARPAAGSDAPAYIRDPDEIYRQSFAAIEAEADFSSIPDDLRGVARRLIHACGMVDLTGDLAFSPDAAAAGRAALAAGAPIICDVEMVRHGIIARLLPAGNEILCMINDAQVPVLAKRLATTRSAGQVDLWLPRLGGAIIAIGNAPTALFRLLELIDAGAPKPALIVGMPVGFVGAAESKAELAANPRGIPFITVKGRRGGSAMAAAAVNALAGEMA